MNARATDPVAWLEGAPLPDRQSGLTAIVAEGQSVLRWPLEQIHAHGVSQLVRGIADVEGSSGVAPWTAFDGNNFKPAVCQFVGKNRSSPTDTDDNDVFSR
jgi:hypothetical protein